MSNDKIIIESLKDELEVCNTEKNTLIQENNMLKRSLTDIVEKLRVCNSIPRNTNTDIGMVSEATSQTSREERERISRARERVAAREAQFERESEEREAQFKRESEEREEAARAERERVARARERVAAREAQFERESEEREEAARAEQEERLERSRERLAAARREGEEIVARARERLAESRAARIPEIVRQAQKA